MKAIIYLISTLLLGLTLLTGGEPSSFQKNLYTDTHLIAKSDIGSHASQLESRVDQAGGQVAGRLSSLTGSATLLEWDQGEARTVTVESMLAPAAGQCKLVHIGPDNHVTVLDEGTGSRTLTLTLPKGHNRVKAVGLEADTDIALTIA